MVLCGLLTIVSVLVNYQSGDDAGRQVQHQSVMQYYHAHRTHVNVSTKAIIMVPSWGPKYVMPIKNGTSQKILDTGVVGHFVGTGPVGVGNYALAGHVVTHGEPFAQLPGMVPGQTVVVEKDGWKYTFTVDRKFNVYYTNTSVLNYRPKTLTLVTCASRYFHTDYRTVVTAHLTRKVPA